VGCSHRRYWRLISPLAGRGAAHAHSPSQAAERAGLLHAHPAKLQAPDVAGAPAVHHRQQGSLRADAHRGPGLLWPGPQLHGEVGQEHQVLRRPVGVAGHQVVQHPAVRLGDLAVEQGCRGDHQHAAGLGRDLGERLIQQDAQVAVADPAGLQVLAVAVGPSGSMGVLLGPSLPLRSGYPAARPRRSIVGGAHGASAWHLAPIHLGLDVYKDTISVEILRAAQQVPDVERIGHDEPSVRRLVGRLGDPGMLQACIRAAGSSIPADHPADPKQTMAVALQPRRPQVSIVDLLP
jgi:hypothetical protein